MSPAEILAEWRKCPDLRQADLDRLTAAGINIMHLAFGTDGFGLALVRDRILLHPDGQRFEFERYNRTAWDTDSAFIIVAHDREGEVRDLMAWRPDSFLANWLGRSALLGAENLDAPRIIEAGLRVHPSPLEWLRAGREGVVVVDPRMAAADLRFAEPLLVADPAFAVRLRKMLHQKPPQILVDRPARLEAAE